MTPGAVTSTLLFVLALIGGPPSSGSPSTLNALPKYSSPTRIEVTSPVALTESRVSISLLMLPRLTIPASSASRVRAIPVRPLSNSTTSPDFSDVSP